MMDGGIVSFISLHAALIGAIFFLHVFLFKYYLISEIRIFLFHVVIFLFLPMLSLSGAFALGWQIFTLDAVTLYGLSAIYSLSFLELWSLSEGSYSFQILAAIRSGTSVDVYNQASATGQKKQADRINAIVRLGLARKCDDHLVIIGKGRLVVIVAGLLANAAGAELRE